MKRRTTWIAILMVAACGKGGGTKKEAARDADVVVAPEPAVKVGTDVAKTMWAEGLPAY